MFTEGPSLTDMLEALDRLDESLRREQVEDNRITEYCSYDDRPFFEGRAHGMAQARLHLKRLREEVERWR